jgi:hypothetical protein
MNVTWILFALIAAEYSNSAQNAVRDSFAIPVTNSYQVKRFSGKKSKKPLVAALSRRMACV